MFSRLHFVIAGLTIGLSGCGLDSGSTGASAVRDNNVTDNAECIMTSPLLAYGEGSQFPAHDAIPAPAANLQAGSDAQCSKSDQYRYAAGIADIAGPAGGKSYGGTESPTVYSAGIQARQYARAYVIGSPCNGKRVMMVLSDIGMMFSSVGQGVQDRIAADPVLSKRYGMDNMMLSATHTHSAPGAYSHSMVYNTFHLGYDDQTYQAIVRGIFKAIKQADENYEAHASTGPISMALGELLGANVSRAPEAYKNNSQSERSQYLDNKNGDVNTNRLMTLLRLQRNDGKEVGSINWYAVHPTSDYYSTDGGFPISSDNKGLAMYVWERMKNAVTRSEPFIASFYQADEGDAFSFIWFRNSEEKARRDKTLRAAAHQDDPVPLTTANGMSQLAKALELYARSGARLHGAVDYRTMTVKMDSVVVSDPVILASLKHPAALDANPKRTCTAALGFSFPSGGAGTEPGAKASDSMAPAGLTCTKPDMVAAAQKDVMAAIAGSLPPNTAAYAVGCNLQKLPALNLDCQAEKPILFVVGPPVNGVPDIHTIQIFRIGNLAVIGLPWEVTTMAGRRIRQTVLDVLKTDGVDYAVISGLSNDYAQYLTTREEYAIQQYEGASNQFGPWSLAAVQQELRKLAITLRDKMSAPVGPALPRTSPSLLKVLPPAIADATPPGSSFGSVVTDAQETYAPGDTARAVFQSANPNHNLQTDKSFLWVERKGADGKWQVIARDRDPETTFYWHPDSPEPQLTPSATTTAEIVWRIPRNAQVGTYRLRHTGTQVSFIGLAPTPFEGISREFKVAGQRALCP